MSNPKQKIKILALCASSLLIGNSLTIHADSLMDIYHQAVIHDSNFQQAQADWLAAQQNLPLARAALMPNLSLEAYIAENNQDYTTDASFTQNGSFASSNINLTLNQPIYNWKIWSTLKSAEAGVKAATANYYYAQQDLIARTVQTYLSVLQANDILRFTRANKAAFAEEYDTAKQKFDVGLVPITDVYDAQAKYDQAKAKEIANINTLEDNLETLHEITGQYYEFLNGLSENGIPLLTPTPNDIDAWSATAIKQNYQLQAQYYLTLSSKENIEIQAAGNYPSFGIQGSFSDQRQFDRTLTFTDPERTESLVQQLATIAVGMNLNIFSGGSVVASTRQARQQYASASAKEETIHRQVVGATRKAFLGVNAYGTQVRADELSVKSSKSALDSARAAYKVGSRTLLDVLDDTTQLYQNQQTFAVDQYAYMNNFVALKEVAGTLSPADVAKLSSWLTQPINLEAAKQISTTTNTTEPRQATPPPEKSSAESRPQATVTS